MSDNRIIHAVAVAYLLNANAPTNTPHLHFAIFLLTDKKQWWHGTALNPFDVWVTR